MPTDKKIPYSKEELFGVCEQKSYTGQALKEIAFPLGGIGTGNVSLGGRGQLRDWEIFNRPGKNKGLMYTFPAIFTRTASGDDDGAGSGIQAAAAVCRSRRDCRRRRSAGCPGWRAPSSRASIRSRMIEFVDDKLPVKVELTAFNPFIPLNEKDSAIPTAILRYKLTNTSKERVDATVCWSMQNACGNDGTRSGRRETTRTTAQQENRFRG